MFDLEPAAHQMARLIAATPDERLASATPCEAYSLGDLLDHVGGLTRAFTTAATKQGESTGATSAPQGDAANLPDDWRTRIPADLDELVIAWRDPEAWTGMTAAGGIELPGEVAGVVALNELVVHGWDVAKAIGESYEGDTVAIEACHDFVTQFSGPESGDARAGAFGPVVDVPEQAPLLDRLVGLAGRDPDWSRD